MKNDEPIAGKVYALTGGSTDKALSNGNSWKESQIKAPTDYITIKTHPDLVGKRARFKQNLPGYSRKLWGATGTIQQLFLVTKGDLDHVGLSIVFDKKTTNMPSCYITPNSYEVQE